MKILKRLDDGLARGEAAVVTVVLLAMIGAAALQALVRNLATRNVELALGIVDHIEWIDEFLMKGTLWVAFLGASLATHGEKHIAIDVLPRLATPKVRAAIRGVVGVAAAVITFYLAQVFLLSIENLDSIPSQDWTMISGAHLCDASAEELEIARYTRPAVFCGIRGFMEALALPRSTPQTILQLIVPAMLVVMSVRFLGRGIAAFLSIPKGGDHHVLPATAEHAVTGDSAEGAGADGETAQDPKPGEER